MGNQFLFALPAALFWGVRQMGTGTRFVQLEC
jgi:hypothetical protein